jgi:hypothetical protein
MNQDGFTIFQLYDFIKGNEYNKCYRQSLQHIFIMDNMTCFDNERISIIRPDDGYPFIAKTYSLVLDECMLY